MIDYYAMGLACAGLPHSVGSILMFLAARIPVHSKYSCLLNGCAVCFYGIALLNPVMCMYAVKEKAKCMTKNFRIGI